MANLEEVKDLLGGYNCGACGYADCEEMAQALINGEATADLCIPNSQENTQKLEKLLNK